MQQGLNGSQFTKKYFSCIFRWFLAYISETKWNFQILFVSRERTSKNLSNWYSIFIKKKFFEGIKCICFWKNIKFMNFQLVFSIYLQNYSKILNSDFFSWNNVKKTIRIFRHTISKLLKKGPYPPSKF